MLRSIMRRHGCSSAGLTARPGHQGRQRQQCRWGLRAQAPPGPSSAVDAAGPRHADLERLLPLEASAAAPLSQLAGRNGSSALEQPAAAEVTLLGHRHLPAAATGATADGGKPAAAALQPSSAQQQEPAAASDSATGRLSATLAKLGLSDRTLGLICMNLAVLMYGSNWVVVKESGAEFDPYLFSALRFGVAALAFTPALLPALKDSRVVRAGLELGLWTGAGYLLQSEGLMTTDASRASFLSTFTVIIVPVLAGLSGRGVRPLTWLAAVAALGGVGLLEGGGAPPAIGDAWSFLSAIAFGVQVFRTEHWARRLGPKRTLPLTAAMLWVTMGVSLGAAAVAHPGTALQLFQDPGLLPRSFQEGALPWQAALYTGILTTDICLLLEVVALRLISSTEAAIIFALEPVLGAAFAYWLLGERWGPLGWAGAGLIIASSLATQLSGGEAGDPVLESGSESETE